MIKKITEQDLQKDFDFIIESVTNEKVTYIIFDEQTGKDKVVLMPYNEYEKAIRL